MFAGLAVCLLIPCVFTRGRIFWEDEMLGWMLVHDPSWNHMVAAWKAGADGGGFLFYLLGRAWFAVFGGSNVSFRLISAVCFGLAFCVTWAAGRRFYGVGPVALGLFNTWFFSPPMVIHMAEGRFYGLLVLTTSLVMWLVLTRCQAETKGPVRTPPWLYPAMFVLNAALTTSHVLGVLYSGALLFALVLQDVRARRVRLALYAAGMLSWLLLLPERDGILNSARIGKPWFWTVPPDGVRFLGGLTGFSPEIVVVEAALVVLLCVSLVRGPEPPREVLRTAIAQRRPVYYVTAALLAVPFGLAVHARFATSLYISRYLLPVNIALAFAAMEALTLIRWERLLPRRAALLLQWRTVRLAGAGAFALGLLLWVFHHVMPMRIGAPEYTAGMTAQLPKGVPVLFEDAWGFTETIGLEHSSGVLYTYLLDWPYVTSPAAPKLEVTQFHLMENWRRVGYFSGSIEYRDEFLRKYDRFIVLRRLVKARDRYGILIGNPLAERFAQTPGYQVVKYKWLSGTDEVAWLVCKGTCAPEALPAR